MPPPPPMPALEQNRSIGPNRSSVCSTTFTMSASTLTSAVSPSAVSPSSSATAVTASASRSTITRPCGPSAANRRHSARPMPLPPPVTTTTLPASSTTASLQSRGGDRALGHGATVGAPRHRHDHGHLDAGVDIGLHGGPHVVLVAHDVDRVDERVGHGRDRTVTITRLLALTDRGDV